MGRLGSMSSAQGSEEWEDGTSAGDTRNGEVGTPAPLADMRVSCGIPQTYPPAERVLQWSLR